MSPPHVFDKSNDGVGLNKSEDHGGKSQIIFNSMIGSIITDLNNAVGKLHILDKNIGENIKEPTNH